MKKGERCLKILEILQEQHQVDVTELANLFQTSEMTIRRDLNFLAREHNITRTHGGAIMTGQSVVRIASFDEERIANKDAKEKIAKKAASLIENHQSLFIDAGSTTRIVVDHMDPEMKALIVTNHIGVAEKAMSYENSSVIMLGGEMLKDTNCSSGEVAEEQIKKYTLDIAFLGAGAIDAKGHLNDWYSPEARFKKTIFSVAEKVYVLADSSKFNNGGVVCYGELSQIHALITDAGISEKNRLLLKQYNVELIIAE